MSIEFKRLPVFVEAFKRKPKADIFIYYSSRGTGKTYDISLLTVQDKFDKFGGDTIAARKKKNKTFQSINKEIKRVLQNHSLEQFFNFSREKIETKGKIFGRQRSIVFEGGRDPEDLKSYSGFKDLWLEEANQFSAEDIEILVPSIRERGGRLFLSSNPVSSRHWLFKRYVQNEGDPSICAIKSTYKDNPFLNGGDVAGWLNKQRIAYFGNDLGFRIEVLGEELEFGTARLIKDFSLCPESLAESVKGKFFTGVSVAGNRTSFVEVLVGRVNFLPVVLVTKTSSGILITPENYQEELKKFRGTLILPPDREELRFVFSKMRRGSILADKKHFFALADFLISKKLHVVDIPENFKVISEFEEAEYYFDEEEEGNVSNLVMQNNLFFINAFKNAMSVLM